MRLYHFTDKLIKDKIKTSYFAENAYTARDKDVSRVKRAFFFTTCKPPEYRFYNCRYKHIINIDKKNIYNLIKDKSGYIKKYKTIDKILKAIKKDYIACIYNVGYDVIISFKDISI